MTDQATTIPKGWKMTTLGEVADIKGGKRLPMGKSLVTQRTKHPYIRITDIENNKIKKDQLQFVPDDVFSSISRYIVNSGDVIVSIVGSIGFVAKIDDDLDNASLTENCVKFVNLKNLDSKYLYYFLTSKPGQDEIERNTVGAVQKKLPIYGVQNIQIPSPLISEQRAIAAVLSSLDDKIELLREQNKTLEATAQAIFKEWFVNFNFPGATGKMIESELGEIPEGWRVGRIKDLVDILSGFAFSSSDFSQDGKYKLVTIKNVQDRYFDPETKDRLSSLPAKMPSYCKLNSGDILLSLTGNVGRICLVNGDNFLLNQRVAKLKEISPNDYAFTYLLFLQDSIFSLLQSTASGTAQQNLSPIQTKEIEIIVADRETLNQFGMVANKLIQKINDNNSQIETLSKLRDTLLPKVMKGEVRVKEFEN